MVCVSEGGFLAYSADEHSFATFHLQIKIVSRQCFVLKSSGHFCWCILSKKGKFILTQQYYFQPQLCKCAFTLREVVQLHAKHSDEKSLIPQYSAVILQKQNKILPEDFLTAFVTAEAWKQMFDQRWQGQKTFDHMQTLPVHTAWSRQRLRQQELLCVLCSKHPFSFCPAAHGWCSQNAGYQ